MGSQHLTQVQRDQGTCSVCSTHSVHEEDVLLTERIMHFQLSHMLASDKKSHNGWEEENGEDDRMDRHLFPAHYDVTVMSFSFLQLFTVIGSKIFIVLSVLWNGVLQDGSIKLTQRCHAAKTEPKSEILEVFLLRKTPNLEVYQMRIAGL